MNGRGGAEYLARPLSTSTMLSSVLTIYFIDSRKHQIYSCNMRKLIAAIKRGVSRRPREIESVLAFQCSMQWDELLKADGDESQRFCTTCSKNVHLTVSDWAYKENARLGKCVSIPAGTKLKIKGKDVTIPMPTAGVPTYYDDGDDHSFFNDDDD
jgi:hypothetical protein